MTMEIGGDLLEAMATGRRLVAVSDLNANKQAIVLGMVYDNVFPKGVIQKRHPWFGKTRKGFDCLSGRGFARLQELIALGYSNAVEQGKGIALAHHRQWSASCMVELMSPPTDSGIDEAIRLASRAAESTGVPQTVYRNQDSGGWTCTHAFARAIEQATGVVMTALPERYFS